MGALRLMGVVDGWATAIGAPEATALGALEMGA